MLLALGLLDSGWDLDLRPPILKPSDLDQIPDSSPCKWDLSTSIAKWAISYNKSLCVSLYPSDMYPLVSVSTELFNTGT